MLTFLFPAVDCEVSPWSSWSGCSERCGEGYSERRRYVLTEHQNAGAKCPKLREFRGCKDYRGCEVEMHRETVSPIVIGCSSLYLHISRECVAMILPYKYSQSRTGPQWEHPKARAPRFDNYCVHFKFKRFHPTCETPGIVNWTTSLEKGSKACVECSRPAYGSSGYAAGRDTETKDSMGSRDIQGCRGVWQRTSIEKDCKCGEENENRFIFV
ncbi:putative somatomedin-B and thrombospondin type-1 domain-containing protein [Apostichopus japonicus]|uniref:Putative somatomedin-B and thrombospondin type-1 domain-containing protein n=1 Tax=Stichopus japonicus TaxID=307972 RepID=A0A2G8JT69_STIJA|nr:putative somatomedin-B and thrombospondin type-1 domain-containing protein [Apostichopus japonicus]